MNEKPEKPATLNYQRPAPSGLFDNGPLVAGTVITLGALGVLTLVKAFLAMATGADQVLVPLGVFFVMAAIVIWQIERNW